MTRKRRPTYWGKLCQKCGTHERFVEKNECRQCRRDAARARYLGRTQDYLKRRKDLSKVREDARKAGERFYHPCFPCLSHPDSAFYVSTADCVGCSQERNRRKRVEFPEYNAERSREYRGVQLAKRPWYYLVSGARHRAKRAGLPFDLDRGWAARRWTGSCELSGVTFQRNPFGKNGPWPLSPSIDRIDPSLGYTKDNCRFILMGLNSAKLNSVGDAELLRMAQALVTHQTVQRTVVPQDHFSTPRIFD